MPLDPASRPLPLLTLAVLAVCALLLRLPAIGNPLLDIDEQFYLLVGDAMLHGALPYVDIWDRKPIGLFLIYAAIRLTGGDGVVQYQVVALLFAVATAATIVAIARRATGAVAAAGAGIAYLVSLNFLGGVGGQSPVFYNLPTALAGLTTLTALDAAATDQRRRANLAMLAMGVGLLIKPTVLFEGCLFGATFLWLTWLHQPRARAVAGTALRLIAIALAPTLSAYLFYAAIGQEAAFRFANVTSIFLRESPPGVDPTGKLTGIALMLLPLAATAMVGLASQWRDRARDARFVALWLGVAVAGFLALPPWLNHYGLPLLVPLSVASGWAFGRGMLWRWVVGGFAAVLLLLSGYPGWNETAAARRRLNALDAAIVPHLHGGCLFVFEGPTALYRSTGACRPSRFAFPNHLNYLGEAKAIGTDPAGEVRRILASRPAVIVTVPRHAIVEANPATWDIVEAALRSSYHPVAQIPGGQQLFQVYARNGG